MPRAGATQPGPVTTYEGGMTMDMVARFWSHVDVSGECWVWLGCRNHRGYGLFGVNGKCRSAHRVAYEIAHGIIPDGLFVLHRCDNPACVRPDHLWLGTHADNMNDRNVKGRTAKGERHAARIHPERMPRGEKHYLAKLTDTQVRFIREQEDIGVSRRALCTAVWRI